MTSQLRQRLLGFGALACIGLLLADRLVIGPAVDAAARHRRRVRALQADVQTARLLVDQEAQWRSRLEEFRTHAFPPGRSASENAVIKTLRQWVGECALDLTAMRTRWRPEAGIPCLEVHLNAGGDLAAVTRFLYLAETARAPIRVTNISLTSSSASSRALSMTVDLEAISWHPSAAGAAGGGPT